MLWLISAAVTLAPFAIWAVRAYLAHAAATAVALERQAGAAISQNEANNAEADRLNRAAAADSQLRGGQPDPNDRDRP
jgi:hypothetical protein